MPDGSVQVWHYAIDSMAIFPSTTGHVRATLDTSTALTSPPLCSLLCHEFMNKPERLDGRNDAKVTYSVGEIAPEDRRKHAWPTSEVHLHFDHNGVLRVLLRRGRRVEDWSVYLLPPRASFLSSPLSFMTLRPMCLRCLVHSQACRHNQSATGVQAILDTMLRDISPEMTRQRHPEDAQPDVRRPLLEPLLSIAWRLAAYSMTCTSVLLRVRSIWEGVSADSPGAVSRDVTVRDKLMRKRRRVQVVMLMVMDVLLGFLCCRLCLAYEEEIARLGYQLWEYSLQTQVVKDRVAWVMQQHAPMGFKLNERLDTVLGTMVILAVDSWHLVASLLADSIQVAFSYLFALAQFGGGASFLLSMSYDAVLVLTLHVKLLYVVFARMYRVQVLVLSSLFKLLRGKKQNVLRNRVDHCDYDKTQLLTGSIIFIVCLFLLQTSMAYYIMFSTLWALIMTLLALLWWLIALFHTVPLYCFADNVLRKGGTHAAPAGIKLIPIQDSESSARWRVESKPISTWSLLVSWLGFCFSLLLKEYYGMLNTGVIRSFASGRIVRNPPLPFDLAADETCPASH